MMHLYDAAREKQSLNDLLLNLEVSKLKQEKQLLQRHAESVEDSLHIARKELSEARKQNGDALLDKDWAVSSLNSELEQRENSLAALEDKITRQEERMKGYLDQVESLELAAASRESRNLEELDEKNALIGLYKQAYDEVLSKVAAVERREASLREDTNAQMTELHAIFQEKLQQAQDLLNQEREARSSMEDQLHEHESALPAQSMAIVIPDLEMMNVTELYNRAIAAEHARALESSRRQEAEEYLQNILRDVERKAPVIANQRRDYLRMKETHEKLTDQVNVLLTDIAQLRQVVCKAASSEADSRQRIASLDTQNRDLSEQVRFLLKRQQTECSDVVSKYLLTFADIDELQDKNMKLLEVVRRLSQEQEQEQQEQDHREPFLPASVSVSLYEALSELQRTKDARQKAEDMIIDLIEQRDMYRGLAMAEGHEGGQGQQQGPFSSSSGGSPSADSALKPSFAPLGTSKMHELQRKLAEREEEVSLLKATLSESDSSKTLLSDRLLKEKEESASIRMQLAQSSGECRSYKESAAQLEDNIKKARLENVRCIQRYSDMEKKTLELSREMRLKEQSLEDFSREMQSLKDAISRKELELGFTKTNEASIAQQVLLLEQQLEQQTAAIASVSRISQEMSSTMDDAHAGLILERDGLAKEVENLRRQLLDRNLIGEQRVVVLEDDLKNARAEAERKAAELSQARAVMLREQNSVKVVAEKCTLLERQLAISQERLASARGMMSLESTSLQIASESDFALERAQADVENLRAQVAAAEAHTEEYRKIAADNEVVLNELRRKSAEATKAYEDKVRRLTLELTTAKQEYVDFRSTHGSAQDDLERLQSLLHDTKTRLEDATSKSLEFRETSSRELELATQREDDLKAEVWRLQQTAKIAYLNYDREKELHTKADTRASELDVKLASTQATLSSIEQKFADLSADCISRDSREKKDTREKEKETAEAAAKMDSLQRTRDLLTSQVQMMEAKLSRLEEAARENATSGGNPFPENSQSAENELAESRRSESELREVLFFIKRERDVLDSKLSVAETESARHQATLSATQKALEETRSMLKRESEKLAPMRDETEFEKLLLEVSKLNQVSESNSHLRKENADLTSRVAALMQELNKRSNRSAPLESAIEKLKADKEALEQTNTQLLADASLWKERLQHLLGRYKDVDPEDHRVLRESFDTATTEITKKESQFVNLTATYESLEKNATTLRTKMRQMQAQMSEAAKDAEAKVSSYEEQIAALVRELAVQKEQKEAAEAASAAAAEKAAMAEKAALAATAAAEKAGKAGKVEKAEKSGDEDMTMDSTPAPAPAVASAVATAATASTPSTAAAANRKRSAPEAASSADSPATREGDPAGVAPAPRNDEYLKAFKEQLLMSKSRTESLGKLSSSTPAANASTSEQQAFKKTKDEQTPFAASKAAAANSKPGTKKGKQSLNPNASPFLPPPEAGKVTFAAKPIATMAAAAAAAAAGAGAGAGTGAAGTLKKVTAVTAAEKEKKKAERANRFQLPLPANPSSTGKSYAMDGDEHEDGEEHEGEDE